MDYKRFADTINSTVFSEFKVKLLQSIANHPSIYVGLFRPTRPEVKIAQNLSQSHQIKFGHALEQLVRLYLEENGCKMLPTSIDIGGEKKELDIHFRKGRKTYFVEQKIRDNHDSTKKRGQIDDFQKKLVALNGAGRRVGGILFFVDPGMAQNKKFYTERLDAIKNQHGFEVAIVYGKEFFSMLSLGAVWDEIVQHLVKWRQGLPSFPEFDYDVRAEESFNEIKDMDWSDFQKLFTNDEVGKHILPILFPTGETLGMLADYWHNTLDPKRGREIARLIEKRKAEIEKK